MFGLASPASTRGRRPQCSGPLLQRRRETPAVQRRKKQPGRTSSLRVSIPARPLAERDDRERVEGRDLAPVEGHTDAARLGVRGERLLEQMVPVLGDVLVEARVALREDDLVLPELADRRALLLLGRAALLVGLGLRGGNRQGRARRFRGGRDVDILRRRVSRRRRGRDVDIPWRARSRGDAAAPSRDPSAAVRRARAEASLGSRLRRRPRREYSAETGSRRRRGRDVEIPWGRVAATPRPR